MKWPTLTAMLAAALWATPASAAEFDVATVKLSPPPQGNSININLGMVANGRVTLTNVTLGDCLKFAYGLVSDDQISAPAWTRETRFDIVGQGPAETSREEAQAMVQSLLAERLKVALHKEQRDLPHLELTLLKSGTKLKETDPSGPPAGPQVRGRIHNPHMAMLGLALLLSRFERQLVIDRTGLPGVYDVQLDWTPEQTSSSPAVDVPAGPSVYTALREQLGLRLESRRGPVDVLVVDSAAQIPVEN